MIDVSEWDKLVQESYGKPYSFQQQEGCQSRGLRRIKVPDESEDFENDSIPEKINGEEMGVSFEAWKARDPKTPVDGRKERWEINLFWERNFYPDLQTVANDLHAQGKLEAGEYTIDIDW
jgi:hypothetical protein